MRRSLRLTMLLISFLFGSLNLLAQNVTLTGTITGANGELLPAVSVGVKGSSQGTFTDDKGNFRISVASLPATLVVSSVGYETREVEVTSAAAPITINLTGASSLGQEVVVSATRAPERILETPVTVEKMNSTTIRNVPAPSYYEAINNLKGVDMHTASLTFRTVTTRGFISSGNTRLNQLIDGMDNQAPGLNFAVGSVIGPGELDVDNVELLSGASSALYGSGGVNGTLLINSKSPFRYQGFSLQVKQGVMHINDKQRGASPYYDWSARYAKSWNDKFGFKITTQLVKANDWEAYDYRNVRRNSVVSKVVGGNRENDPNYDGINVYGDETTANMRSVAQSVVFAGTQGFLQAALGLPSAPTLTQVQTILAANPALITPLNGFLASNAQTSPFFNGLNSGTISNQNVSRTGYQERYLVDYNTVNYKINGGLFYKITPRIEASLNSYVGTGTTVYTGADRYSLKGLKMAQHKLELRHNNWFVRGYTTQENAGNSYNATVLGRLINESWKPSTTWYPQYVAAYTQSRQAGASDYVAHQNARAFADQGRLMPGTSSFNQTANTIKGRAIPSGAKFLDRSDLYAAEGQLNLSQVAGFNNIVEVIAGTQYKQYVLNSQGTIFADTAGKIKVSEIGGYLQLKKRLFNDALTLTAAGRYDKHTNFEGRFTPRITGVLRVAPENFLRASYQTAYRFPTNQDQYINLNVGSGFLIGFLPSFQEKYGLKTTPGYTAESIDAYRSSGNPANTQLLKTYTFRDVKAETVNSYEVGYKGVIGKRFFFDAYGYLSSFNNFVGRVAVGQPVTGTPTDIFNPATTRNLSFVQNATTEIKAQGWGLTAEFQLARKFVAYGNIFSDKLRDVPSGFATFFNAPEYRYNIGLRNENVYRNIGFNVVFKWQDHNFYEGTFVTGTLPAYGTLDGQISYRIPKSKSLFRIGATNIGNNYYRSGFGSPSVGGLYYASFGYNLF